LSARTKLILLLVLIGALFVGVICADIVLKRQRGDKVGTGALTDFADNALLQLTESLAPKLRLTALRCGQQRVNRPFTLDAALSGCELRIRRKKGTDVRTAKLYASGPGMDSYVFASFDEKKFAERERDPATCIQDAAKLEPFRLEVEYEPADGPATDWTCWLKQKRGKPISIVALEDGGRLNLKCAGCDAGSRSIRLEFR
jgi:hypothetical protein